MKRSGCYYIAFGIESANAEILKNIRKQETLLTIQNAINMTEAVGISCQGFFIFGLPGETPETLEETLTFAVNSKLSRAQFLILDVIPGSELWDTLGGSFEPNRTKNSFKEPEWLPKEVTRDQLMRTQAKAFRRFYLKPSRIMKLAIRVRPRQIKFLCRRLKEYRIVKAT